MHRHHEYNKQVLNMLYEQRFQDLNKQLQSAVARNQNHYPKQTYMSVCLLVLA